MARTDVPKDLQSELSPEYREHLKKADAGQFQQTFEDYTSNFKLIHETDKAVFLQPMEETEPEAWVPRSRIFADG